MKRSKNDRIIAGVCGGIGESMGIEPWLFRILFLVLGGFNAFGLYFFAIKIVWIYLLMWIFIEEEY